MIAKTSQHLLWRKKITQVNKKTLFVLNENMTTFLVGADSRFGIYFLVARQILELQRKAFLGI